MPRDTLLRPRTVRALQARAFRTCRVVYNGPPGELAARTYLDSLEVVDQRTGRVVARGTDFERTRCGPGGPPPGDS